MFPRRLLLDPAAEGGGGAGGTAGQGQGGGQGTAGTGNAQQGAPPPAAPALAPGQVAVSEADFVSLRAARDELKSLREEREAERKAAAEANEKALIEKGKYEEAIRVRDERIGRETADLGAKLAAKEAAFKRTLLDRELLDALAGRPDLSPGAATDIAVLLRGEFEVVEEAGQYRVRTTKDLQSAADRLASFLADPKRAYYLKANGGGGAGAEGAGHAGPGAGAGDAATTAGQDYQRWLAQQKAAADRGYLPRGI